ncbi:MAG: restriction endonuclease subunit S [Granulosicoccus sp.]
MAAVEELVTEHIDVWTSSIKRKSSAGRGGGKKIELYGVKKLRLLILDLAVRGFLVQQDPNDEPASELLKRIATEKAELVKAKEIKNQKPLPEISDDEKPYDLPTNWIWTRLGSLAEVAPRNTAEDKTQVGFVPMPLISTSHNGEHGQQIKTWIEIKKGYTHFADGDIGLAKITPCFENSKAVVFVGLKNGIGSGTTELHIARPIGTFINPWFVLLHLKSPRFLLIGETKMTGTAGQRRIPKNYFTDTPLPLPPLTEQHRIVAKVDELMALCDQLEQQSEANITAHQTLVETLLGALTQNTSTATSPTAQHDGDQATTHNTFEQAWHRIAEHFDTLFTTEHSIELLKQSILQLAVMGKLVPQDPNDEPASELLKRIAAEKAELVKAKKIKKQKALPKISEEERPFELPKGWAWVRFDDIAKNEKNALKAGPFGSALKKIYYVESGYKIYGQEQVISGDENFGDYYINKEKYLSLESCRVKAGDILISLVGTIGKVLVISDTAAQGIINPRLVKLSLNENISKKFIQTILGSRLIKDELSDKSHGSTMDVLNLGLLRNLVFPLPPLPEQHRILTKADELSTICHQLKTRLADAQNTQLQLADAVTEQAIR